MNLRDILHSLSDAIADHIERTAHSAEYYDQDSTPLPKEHARLVREGAIPGFKVKRRILVKRLDMHAYIEAHRVEPHAAPSAENGEDAAIDELLGRAKLQRAG